MLTHRRRAGRRDGVEKGASRRSAGATAKTVVVVALAVLPISLLCVAANDQACNHLAGDISVAEQGTPRGSWCDAVQWHSRWLVTVFGPPAVAAMLVVLAGRRRRRRPWVDYLAWSVGAILAIALAIYGSRLRAYELI
jgi:cytochrome bd-type quinol oxidase subunit 2